MPELNVAAVEQYTQGRLDRDDPLTAELLADGLGTARRWCGWHVTPVIDDDVHVLDGPGSRLLALPTLRLAYPVALTIVENGVELDGADIDVSLRGMVTKRNGALWTNRLGGIAVTMSHGFDAAPDFNAAVLSLVDRMSLAASGVPVSVGPFRWSEDKPEGVFTAGERGRLEQYRLEAPA